MSEAHVFLHESAKPGSAGAGPGFALRQTNCSVVFIPIDSNDNYAKATSKQV
jgi:hypothetical protein